MCIRAAPLAASGGRSTSSLGMQRPQDTLRKLCDVFPPFRDEWEEEGAPMEDGLVDGVYYQWTHHAVMRAFLSFFAANQGSFTETQLRRFGDWVNQVVSASDDLENAVSTCFLEHLHQVKADRLLAPYLSRQAKERRHA